MEQICKRTPMPKCDFNKFALKSHFGMGVFLESCCIFSEHLLLKTPQAAAYEERLRYSFFPVSFPKVHLWTTASERALDFTKMVPIPIPIKFLTLVIKSSLHFFLFPGCLRLISGNFHKNFVKGFLVLGFFLPSELKRMYRDSFLEQIFFLLFLIAV